MKDNVKDSLEGSFKDLARWEKMAFKIKERYPSFTWNEAEARYTINGEISLFPKFPYLEVTVTGPKVTDSYSYHRTTKSLFKKIDFYIKENLSLKPKKTSSESITRSIQSFTNTLELWMSSVIFLQNTYSDFKMSEFGDYCNFGKELTLLLDLSQSRLKIYSDEIGSSYHVGNTTKGLIAHISKVLAQAHHQKVTILRLEKKQRRLKRLLASAA